MLKRVNLIFREKLWYVVIKKIYYNKLILVVKANIKQGDIVKSVEQLYVEQFISVQVRISSLIFF